jgi:RecB family exonuclease
VRARQNKAETTTIVSAIAGAAPVKRFVGLPGGTKSVNHEFEAKAEALAWLQGNLTNLQALPRFLPEIQIRSMVNRRGYFGDVEEGDIP